MLSIITLKKIQEGKGLERNGVKGSKGGLMEEVTLEQKLELARRRQERGQHPQGKPSRPTGWGHIQGKAGARGTWAPGHPRVSGEQRGWPICVIGQPGASGEKGGSKQAYHGAERQDSEGHRSLHSLGLLAWNISLHRKQD